jgi:hypothetical protein
MTTVILGVLVWITTAGSAKMDVKEFKTMDACIAFSQQHVAEAERSPGFSRFVLGKCVPAQKGTEI